MRYWGRKAGFLLLLIAFGISFSCVLAAPLPRVVVLDPGPAAKSPPIWIHAFIEALSELGWVEGRTVKIEIYYADDQVDRMAALARQAAASSPSLLFTHGTHPMIGAVAGATRTIPIVVGAGGDLVEAGFAESLARPGRNLTGMTLLYRDLELKRLELLTELSPKIRKVGFLLNVLAGTGWEARFQELARPLGVQLIYVRVTRPDEIRAAILGMKTSGAEGVLVLDEPMLATARAEVVAATRAARLPCISQSPGFADAGGTLQYGTDILESFRRSAGQVDKILRGAKPGDIPIEQPTEIQLIVNRRSAAALGLRIPPDLMARATRVIQ
jgi:putative ABC transport system substrate-binding protein